MPKKPAEPRPVGRPRSIPAGARPRALRLTDSEYAAVLALVAKLRAQPINSKSSAAS